MNDYADILTRIDEALVNFIELLDEEARLLESQPVDIEALLRTCEQKGTATVRLDQLEHARAAFLEQQGVGADRASGDRYALDNDVNDLWQRLLLQTEAASQRNRHNGFVIGRKLDFHNRALSFLQNAAGMTLYGPNGRQRGMGGTSTYLCG